MPDEIGFARYDKHVVTEAVKRIWRADIDERERQAEELTQNIMRSRRKKAEAWNRRYWWLLGVRSTPPTKAVARQMAENWVNRHTLNISKLEAFYEIKDLVAHCDDTHVSLSAKAVKYLGLGETPDENRNNAP